MGIVYEALDRERGTRVALKTLRNASAEHLARLKREFRTMQDIQHPNLVTVRELVCEDERWFLTMEFVEGVDFIEHVRLGGWSRDQAPTSSSLPAENQPTVPAGGKEAALFDEPRLRSALRQLTEGLLALHAAGMVHCDIKPSNVLVTSDGRVVVLDFGLVAETRADASTIGIVGTPAYMAPEQAGGEVGPDADWYAVGVLLYQALTGIVPFIGPPMQVMMRKQSEVPIPPSHVGGAVPKDLEALCNALLRFKVSERARGGAILRALGAGVTGESGVSASRTLSPAFVGRAQEMAVLVDALKASRSAGVAVVVEGESGVGKSRLVRRFTEQVLLEDPRAVVLTGRCYERESVPYKAFDGVVDVLARLMMRMPEMEARALLPTRPAPLAQVFPVLQRVPSVAELTRQRAPALDPLELRSRAFHALREMLTRLGDVRPLVVVIDDAQWADDDSLALLAELTRAPEAPRLLLVATVRNVTARPDEPMLSGDQSTVARLARAIGMTMQGVALGPLSHEEARELANELVGRAGGEALRRIDVDAIANEARGHPLFIDVLARQVASGKAGAHIETRLEDALGAQIYALDDDARQVAEVVALSEAPLPHRVVGKTVGLAPDRVERAVRHLRVARLIAASGVRGDDRVQPYHDRVRGAVTATLAAERRVEIHRAIALALEAEPDADPAALALHWHEAGDVEQAARFSALAADRACQALAFDRAARLYERALAPESLQGADRRALLLKLGDALANGGRGKRAADVFRLAAEGASAADALDLRRRAAEQLLRSGHFDEGVELLERVLASVGVDMPATPAGAILSLLFYRVLLLLRGLGFRERDSSEVPQAALVRIDTCWSAAFGLVMSDHVRGAALQARMLLEALRLGETFRIATALSAEIAYSATAGGRTAAHVQAIITRATTAAERSGQPRAIAWSAGCTGVSRYLLGRWREALENCDRAQEMFSQCVGVAWEVDSARFFAVNSLAQLGELRVLAERSSSYLRDASDRGDLYAMVNLRIGLGNLRWLVSDEVPEARRQVDEAMARWSKHGFHLEHYYELQARTNADLYAGAADEALARLESRWPALRGSLLPMRIQVTRIHSWHLRARAALAIAAESGPGRERSDRLRGAVADVERIERERSPWATPLATLLRAGIARVQGRDAAAVSLLRTAEKGLDAAGMALHANVARHALGALVGGDEGKALTAQVDVWFANQTIKCPDGFFAMLAPGLSARPASARAKRMVDARESDVRRPAAPDSVRIRLVGDSKPPSPMSVPESSGGATRLGEALQLQLAALSDDQRVIMHAVALADIPLSVRVAERASGLSPKAFSQASSSLRELRFVVITGSDSEKRIELCHDRGRGAVFAALAPARRAEVHASIAKALASDPDVDPEALALHWRGAGDAEQAAYHAVLAGDRAVAALAFDRAASLYEQALELVVRPPAEQRALYVKLGDALANAGRGERSARAYEKAMVGALVADALELRQRAAVQLLRGGQWDEGVRCVRAVLESAGIWVPRTAVQVIFQLLFYRLLLRLRPLRVRERDASQVSRNELTRIDTCRLAALALGNVEVVRGTALQSHELLLALRCGEPIRAACALAQEAIGLSVEGGVTWNRTGRILAMATPLAERTADRYAIAMTRMGAGLRAFLTGRFREAQPACEDASERFGECPGAYWEADVSTRFALESLYYLGRTRELRRRFSAAAAEAKARGNVFAWASLSVGSPGLSPLFDGEPSKVRTRIRDATAAWSRRDFDLVRYYQVYSQTNVDLYEGGGDAALARLKEEWGALRRSLLLRVQFVRFVMWECRARAALATAVSSEAARPRLLRAALADAGRIEREKMAWTLPLADMIRAGAMWLGGEQAGAVTALRTAVTRFDQADMPMHAAAGRRVLGAIVGGSEGTQLRAQSDAWMTEESVKDPARIAAMLAPWSQT